MRQGNNPRRGRGRPGRRPNVPMRSQNFESNGPEGRVRGNATQVYEKYLQLARDSQSAGDRVLAESFLQFAEHYYRILNDSTDPNSRPQPPRDQRDQRADDLYDDEEQADEEAERRPERHTSDRQVSDRQDRGERQERGERQDRGDRQERSDAPGARFDDRRQQARAGDPRYAPPHREAPAAGTEEAPAESTAERETGRSEPVREPAPRRGRRPAAAREAVAEEAGEEDAGLLKMLGQPQRRSNGQASTPTPSAVPAETGSEAAPGAASEEPEVEAPKPRRRRRTTKEAGEADSKVEA